MERQGEAPAVPQPQAAWSRGQWLGIVVAAPAVAWLVARHGPGGPPAGTLPMWPALPLLLAWAVVEEVVFRGGVQRALARSPLGRAWPRLPPRALGLSAANGVTSVLFCLAHALQREPLAAAGLLPVSLLLGASLERSGRLWVPVALHAYFNALWFGALAWRGGP